MRHYQGCSIENQGYICICVGMLVYMDVGMPFCPLTFSSAGSEFHQEL